MDWLKFHVGLLIAEGPDGRYQPIGGVGTLDEARHLADRDYCDRSFLGPEDFYPACYRLWIRGDRGAFYSAWQVTAEELISGGAA